MNSSFIFVILLTAHFLGDFVVQTDEQAKNKSKSNIILLQHVLSYMGTMLLLVCVLNIQVTIAWIALNLIGHFITDWFTSRITARLWASNKIGSFFTVVGFDQWIHVTTLIVSYQVMILS